MQFYKRNLCINWPFFGCHCFLFFLPSWIPKSPPGVHKMSPKWGRPHRRPKNAILQKEFVYKLSIFWKQRFLLFFCPAPRRPQKGFQRHPKSTDLSRGAPLQSDSRDTPTRQIQTVIFKRLQRHPKSTDPKGCFSSLTTNPKKGPPFRKPNIDSLQIRL